MSQAMVMCSANEDRSKFEVLDPPAGCAPGDRVTFEGFPGEPDKLLNSKKKVNTTTVNSSLQCRRILGGQNLVRVCNTVVAAIFGFMTVEDWGE